MIYLRRMMDLIVLSMIPSVISFLCMYHYMRYIVWLICCLLSVLIFFIGNALLIRRFVRDIKSVSTYYAVWLTSFAIYVGGGVLCIINNWDYPFVWIYFHTKFLQILSTPLPHELPKWIAFAVAMAAYLLLILIGRPVFAFRYRKETLRKEVEEQESILRAKEERHRYEQERARMSAAVPYQEPAAEPAVSPHRHKPEREERYSMRQYMKMEAKANRDVHHRKKKIVLRKSSNKKTVHAVSEFFLNLGSYSFYQILSDRASQGDPKWPIIKNYLKRRFDLGIRFNKKH